MAPEITRCAFEIRSAARRLTAPDDEADDSTIGVARRALQGGREAYGVLLGVRELVAKLSDVYADAVEGTRDKSARFERGADAVRDLGTTYSDAAYRLEKEQHALRQRLPRP